MQKMTVQEMEKHPDYIVSNLTGSDYQNTKKVVLIMRDIIRRATKPGFYLDSVLPAFNRCFSGYDLSRLSGDKKAEIIERFVRNNIRYQDDPHDTEYLMYPHVIMREGYGDCDDMTILGCTLAVLAGIKKVQIQAIKYRGEKFYSHVYMVFDDKIYDSCLDENEPPVILRGDTFITRKV